MKMWSEESFDPVLFKKEKILKTIPVSSSKRNH
jgi:hypothetical protein